MNTKTYKQKPKGHNLYDNILFDVYEQQLEKNLSTFVQADRLRNNLIAQGKQKINEQFQQRKKEVDAKGRINRSSLINKHQMIKAQLRFKMCEEIFTAVLKRIKDQIQSDEEQHCLILIKLVVEGALRMFEPELLIRCLPKHARLIERILKDAQETFNAVMQEQTGRSYPISLKVNLIDSLTQRDLQSKQKFGKKRQDEQCTGGVILSDSTGHITYKNTIDTRINILREVCLPSMRSMLWPTGKSKV